MPRSPITEVINSYNALSEVERKVFLDLIDPQPEQEPAKVKRTRKKKAETPAAQKRGLPADNGSSDALCVAQVPGLDVLCGEKEDALIHDPKGGYASYHPFVPAVPAVAKKFSRKNGSKKASESYTANSETLPGTAGSAVREVSRTASAGD